MRNLQIADAFGLIMKLAEKDTNMNHDVRVLIADDHPLMRKGLRLSIEEDQHLKVVGEAFDGESALAMVEKLHPDVTLLDIEMPKLDGLQVAQEIVKRNLKTAVIFLTLHSSEDLFRKAMELGCKGYILKDSAVQEVVAGIWAVAAGRPYLSSAITADLLQRKADSEVKPAQSLTANLTPTERRILQLIAIGKTSKEIGAELSIHYRTVENHRTNICRKLSLEGEGANALLRFALQNKNLL
ncbi:MAG TPA: response regulator transcription factor [Acidobacteriaceae bacterium]|nr:response regulator transcription factor [Acidobacteriaceae bacterium]